MSVGTDSEVLGGSEVGAGTPAPNFNDTGFQTSGATDWNPSSGETSFGGTSVTPVDKAFQGAIAAVETNTLVGSVMVAGSVANRADAIAAGGANFYTKGSTALADVVSAPYSPDKVLSNAQAGLGMPARGLSDGTTATRQQGGLAVQYEPLAATGTGKNNQTFRDILAGNLDEARGYSSAEAEAKAERGLSGAELYNLAASMGMDLAQGAVNFGNSASMASKAGATNFAQVSDQYYGGYAGGPNAAVGSATTQQMAINIAAFAEIAGIELSDKAQRELEGFGATPDQVAAAAPIMSEALTQSMQARGQDAFPGFVDPTDVGLGTGGAVSVPQISTVDNLAGNLALGLSPIGNVYEMGRIAGLDPYNQTQSPLGSVDRGPDLSPPEADQQAPSSGAFFDASRFSDVPSPQTSIGFGTSFGGLGGGLDENGNPSAGGFGASGAAFNGGLTSSFPNFGDMPGQQPSIGFGLGYGDVGNNTSGQGSTATGQNFGSAYGITPEAPAAAVSTGISGREQGAYGGTPTFGQGLNLDTGLASALGLSPDDVAGLSAGGLGLSPNDVGGAVQQSASPSVGLGISGQEQGAYGGAPTFGQGLSFGDNAAQSSPVGLGYEGPQSGAFGGAATFGQGLDLNGGSSSNGPAPDITVTPSDFSAPPSGGLATPSAPSLQDLGIGGVTPLGPSGFGGGLGGQTNLGPSSFAPAEEYAGMNNSAVNPYGFSDASMGSVGTPGVSATLSGLGLSAPEPGMAQTFSPSVMDQGAFGSPSFGQSATALGSNFGASYPGSGVADLGYGSAGMPSGGFANVAGFNQAPGGEVVSNGAPPGLDPSVWAGANGLLTNMGMGSVGTQVASNAPGITPDITVTPSDNFGTPPSSFPSVDMSGGPVARPDFSGAVAGTYAPELMGQGTFGASTFNPGAIGFAGSPSGFSTSPTVDASGGPVARPSESAIGPSTNPDIFLGAQDFGAGLGAPGVAGYGTDLSAGLGSNNVVPDSARDFGVSGGGPGAIPGGGLSFADDANSGITSLFDMPTDSTEQGGVPGVLGGLASAMAAAGLTAADLGVTPDSPDGPSMASVGSTLGAAAAFGGLASVMGADDPDPSAVGQAQSAVDANVSANPSNAAMGAALAGVASPSSLAAEAASAMGGFGGFDGGFGGAAGGPGQAAEGGTTSSADAGNNGGPGGFSGTGEGNDSGAGGGPGGAGSGASGTGSGSGSAGGSGDAGGNGGGAGSASGGESGSAGGGGDSGSY